MTRISYTVRAMRSDDIPAAMHLKDDEGWNQSHKDWELLVNNNQNICLVADFNGSVIGTAASVIYSNTVAWVSMVVIDKRFRGLGISKKLLASLMKKLTFCKSVKLDATPAGLVVYEKIGFVAERKIFRMTNSYVSFRIPYKSDLLPVRGVKEDILEIAKFDRKIFGANRSVLIKALIKDYPDQAWILRKNNRITGYALGRTGVKYNQIGPVGASSVQDAEILISKVLESNVDRPAVVDVPENMKELSQWLQSIGFTNQRYFMRMHYKENLFPGEINLQFLICGPEFG